MDTLMEGSLDGDFVHKLDLDTLFEALCEVLVKGEANSWTRKSSAMKEGWRNTDSTSSTTSNDRMCTEPESRARFETSHFESG